MLRREFIFGLGSGVAWPAVGRGQPKTVPTVGFLSGGQENALRPLAAAFQQGLAEQGYVPGRNVDILYRWADNRYDLLPALAADLVRHQVSVLIATAPGTATALAAKSATTTIPIVFTIGEDPVELGLVKSFSRPGGNITGVNFLTSDLIPKRLELLHKIVPLGTPIGFLVNPAAPQVEAKKREAEMTARTLGARLVILSASAPSEIESVLAAAAQQVGAFLVSNGALFFEAGPELAALAAIHSWPSVYPYRETVTAGGLMSYGASVPDAVRLGGVYVGRILHGEKPSEAADKVRAGDQSQDRKGTRTNDPRSAFGYRRRVDRLTTNVEH
jgi:ABC-type uncharacterized transport system substrate-binding protein